MQFIKYKKPITLSILFFMPVAFLLFLYPSTHNYEPLEVINEDVLEISDDSLKLEGHITILAFYGNKPLENVIAAANLKELIYDKFRGFKKFQVVVVSPLESQVENNKLRQEISSYEELKFWHYTYQSPEAINALYSSLKVEVSLDENFATQHVFIVDKERNQRGRLDDREEREIKKNTEVYGLNSYDCIEVKELKDKLGEDLRILFTEYRQKRKGNFNSDTRRAKDLTGDEKE